MSALGRNAAIGFGAGLILAIAAGALYLWGVRGPAILLELYNYFCV